MHYFDRRFWADLIPNIGLFDLQDVVGVPSVGFILFLQRYEDIFELCYIKYFYVFDELIIQDSFNTGRVLFYDGLSYTKNLFQLFIYRVPRCFAILFGAGHSVVKSDYLCLVKTAIHDNAGEAARQIQRHAIRVEYEDRREVVGGEKHSA